MAREEKERQGSDMLGWVIVGAALFGAILYFWNEIKAWLNNTAANVVERVLGYNAKTTMHRAVCAADRVMNQIRTTAVVYNKQNRLDTHFDKVTIEANALVYEIDEAVIRKIDAEGQITQEFQYKR